MRYESKWDYLEHYGVKGQKHGQRRYQNEDGSLTAEGRDHYGVGDPRKAGGAASSGEQKKAAFKMLFNKKNNHPATAGGAGQKKTDSSETDSNSEKPKKKMSTQEKARKALNIMSRVAQIGAAAALIGYGIKNREKIKEAASLISDAASDIFRVRATSANYRKASITQAKADRLRNQQGYVKDRMLRANKLDRKAEAYRSKARRVGYGL